MAVVPWKAVPTPFDGGGLKLVKWEALAAGDKGLAFVCGDYREKTVHLIGTFGGGNMLIEGSLDPDPGVATFTTLRDDQAEALSRIGAVKISVIREPCMLIRPSAGRGILDVDVWLLLTNTRG